MHLEGAPVLLPLGSTRSIIKREASRLARELPLDRVLLQCYKQTWNIPPTSRKEMSERFSLDVEMLARFNDHVHHDRAPETTKSHEERQEHTKKPVIRKLQILPRQRRVPSLEVMMMMMRQKKLNVRMTARPVHSVLSR